MNFSDSDIAEKSFIATSTPGKVSTLENDTFSEISEKLVNAGFSIYSDFYNEADSINNWRYISTDTDSTLGGYFYYEVPTAPGRRQQS